VDLVINLKVLVVLRSSEAIFLRERSFFDSFSWQQMEQVIFYIVDVIRRGFHGQNNRFWVKSR
jgi:hypothetical protein